MTEKSSSTGQQRKTTPATGTTRDMANQAKETAGQVAADAQQAAGQVVDQARQQVSSRLAGQKDRAAEGLTSVAQALRQTGQQLRDQDQQGVTGYIENAASQVERVSNYLRQNDLGQLVDDVEGFARRQPALFLGGAFVLGLLGARFLKSSRPYTGPMGEYSTGSYAPLARTGAIYSSGAQMGAYAPTGRGMTGQSSSSTTGARAHEQRPEK